MRKQKRRKSRTRRSVHSPTVRTATKTTSTLDRVLRAHNVFAILALIFGTCFLISTPPFQVPDEIAHFDRVFRLAEGGVTQKLENGRSGDYVPASIDTAFRQFRYLSWKSDQKLKKEKIFNALRIPLNQEKRKFDRIDAGNYFYFSYIPQLPAVLIGKLFGMNVLIILYLGRVFGLIFYLICVRYAITLIPEGKWLLLALALMPICLAQAGSYNADCVLYSFSFLGVALLMKTLFDRGPLTLNKETVLLLAIFLVFGVLKVLYLPLVLLVFIIPRNRFKDRLQYYIITISVVVLSAALAFAWLKISSSHSAPADPNANAPQKIASLIHNPFLPVRLVTETMNRFPGSHYRMTIGVLGYGDTRLPDGVYTTYTMTILFLAMIEGCKKFRLSIYSRILFWVLGIVIFLGAFVALWLINPRQNGFVVTGVQGRYFIPALFCFLLAFQGLFPFQLNLSSRKVLILLLFLILFTALFATQMTILDRYYG